MLFIVVTFLCLGLLLYFLLGGADFGAGIVELFTSRRNRSRTRRNSYQAIGPIWEANHMWLIIAIVILFVGFPRIYTVMSIHLHIPLVILLAVSYAHFPDFIITRSGENLSLWQTQAPASTIAALGWALVLGSVFILPFLIYLFYSFQKHPVHEDF